MSFSAGEYRSHMDLLAAASNILLMLPLVELRDTVEAAETLGPLLEPTAYQRGGSENLRDQRDLLDAAVRLKLVAERIHARRHPVPS